MSNNDSLPKILNEIKDELFIQDYHPRFTGTLQELINILNSQDIQTLEELEHSIY